MKNELKTAGAVALIGAAVGGGLALGMGLRVLSTVAVAGLGAGLALGVASTRPFASRSLGASPPAPSLS